MKVNITTIGWGTGTFNVLYGLKKNKDYNLTAIVSVSDSGWSTGEIRDQFGILPPGDIRRAIVALSEDTGIVRKLFEYRFKAGNRMSGHTIGNLLLTALTDITGDFEKGIQELSEMFDVRGKVIPVTLDDTHIGAILENGEKIIGETNICDPKHDGNLAIKELFLIGDGKANPRALEAIQNSDIIILCPGDLYTSLLPNFLIRDICQTIKNSWAKVVYISNIMTKFGETTNFTGENFIKVIEAYLGEGRINYVIANSGIIDKSLIEKYRNEEKKELVSFTSNITTPYKMIYRDVVNENDYIRHDPQKLAGVIADFVGGWIK